MVQHGRLISNTPDSDDILNRDKEFFHLPFSFEKGKSDERSSDFWQSGELGLLSMQSFDENPAKNVCPSVVMICYLLLTHNLGCVFASYPLYLFSLELLVSTENPLQVKVLKGARGSLSNCQLCQLSTLQGIKVVGWFWKNSTKRCWAKGRDLWVNGLTCGGKVVSID